MSVTKAGHHPVFEFNKITEQISIGTNLCCTMRSHLQVLLDEGISADIDLEEERQEHAPNSEIYLWLPVKDRHAPTDTQLRAGVAMLDTLIQSGKKVYVHCKNGHGRSPTLVAAYFIFRGASVDEAIGRIRARRPEIHLEAVQIEALRKYEEAMGKT